MKAVFRISLGRPRRYATASNMPIARAGVELDPPVDGYVMVRLYSAGRPVIRKVWKTRIWGVPLELS